MRQTPIHKLSPSQRRAEIVQILTQAVRRLANSSDNLRNPLENSENDKEISESSLTELDV